MALIDSILNLACLLLWFNWRSLRLAAPEKSPLMSLASTLRKAGPQRRGRWVPLASLTAILGVRGVFYWNVGSALNWTPKLELGVISLPFRSNDVGRMLWFSGLSFLQVLAVFYAWLLLLSVINAKLPNDEPGQRLVRWHLGWVERWPSWLKFMLPMIVTAMVWGLANPSLVQWGMVPAPLSRSHLWQQALLLGLTSFLSWKLLLVAICGLYLVNSYVHLGESYFWTFVNLTGSNLLGPLRRWPLCIGKVDLSPVLAMVVVFGVAHWAGRWLPAMFQRLPLSL